MRRLHLLGLALVTLLVVSAAALVWSRDVSAPAPGAPGVVNGLLTYRDFKVDMATVANAPNRDELEASVKKQIDIVADSGAKPEIMAFFRSQKVTMKQGQVVHGGRFSAAGGVEIEARPQPPERPILLHELLHALHANYLPGGLDNPDVIRFYNNAKRGMLYPPGAYMLINKGEFFAITGSLYLWGFVARPPNNRETLRSKQPHYYEWLGEMFGVRK